jgi:hypothetical protein
MAYTATLTGFPHVIRVNVFQGCGATPGRLVVDTTVSAGAVTNWADVTSLVVSNGTITHTWNDIRAVKAPRVRKGYMRTVFEDSRWKLREATLGTDYNLRDGLGNLIDGTEKTVTELIAILAAASGLTIEAGTTIPTFQPTCYWRGLTAQQALKWLLDYGVCRCLYNPFEDKCKIWAAGAGSLPDVSKRLYRPGPDRGIGEVVAQSAPIIYEGRFSATAVVDNAAGELENLSNYDGDGYFDEFFDHEGTDDIRSRLIASAFRLWKIDDTTDKEILPHRALPLLPEGYASAKVIRDSLQSQMRQHPLHVAGSHRLNSGIVFVSDDPVLDSVGGSLKTTAQVLVGYHSLDSDKRERLEESRAIGSGDSIRNFRFSWIRPIESSETDIGTQVWETVLSDVADALETKYSNPTSTVVLPGWPAITESGRVGAAQYLFSTYPRVQALTRVAFDFDPQRRIF